MRGRLVDISFGLNRKNRVTVELDRDFREDFERLKDQELDIEIGKHREKRSLNANSYFHTLVTSIAAESGRSFDATRQHLVIQYGVLAKNEDGTTAGIMVPASANVDQIYPYTRCFDTREENGVLFKCYLVYKHTSDMDSKEMARLIDGAIDEAKSLGIETDTPEQLARNKALWAKQETKGD